MDIINIIFSIAFLLPGFIFYKVFKCFTYQEKIKTFELTLFSILNSLLLWLLFSPLLYFIKPVKKIVAILISFGGNQNISDEYLKYLFFTLAIFSSIYILSAILGYLFGLLMFRFRKHYSKIYKVLFKKSHYKTVWDQVFESLMYDKNDGNDKIVLIKTISKEFYIGEIGAISDNQDSREIYFLKVQKYDNTEKGFLPVASNYGFFISSKNIEYIHILPDVEEFDFDNYCKNEEIALELEKIKK